ncbi:MAG TPA: bifunctional enoyl-CoA hydratase/phosphate acetyltransferase [Burkholderiaceae bacterium]|nr:bifunctional enoyl-CoA hydratase/phosphate acetyltransferase [Rhodoferax sp.]HNW00437.1 bifunctional enoyl-CoA hydratase/phosphate acetyltransferase [Burkholderiaceae bacterium]MBK7549870.1 bifunctional enoyl-CoA hydratase/phosphate acetyltransferase [Rhodoferax sp.]MBP6492649.1 bifunctional enoyl-CoA hydratase/phosphate acetyltransferase [Rhodoferax sp.]MBP7572367.1 bifunctional enoyl-CoA hydratase/phosphate acetyltransferase [Rhodoferax sp.]
MTTSSASSPANASPLGVLHPRLLALIAQAREQAAATPPAVGLVYPCDTLAIQAAVQIAHTGIARPVLIGPRSEIYRAADAVELDIGAFEVVETHSAAPAAAAAHATRLVHEGALASLMKGSLHTDELMSAVVNRETGLRTGKRISHAFLFDLPRYHKLLTLADCVVNIAPDLKTKRDVLGNAVTLLQTLGVQEPKVAIVSAVESVNPAIIATLDAQALVEMAQAGEWPGAVVEGPFGFDNAFSAVAARIKGMKSQVAGNADLMIMPDLNASNMLYKSFVYVGGGECAGLVLGAKVPIVLTSRADSLLARIASVALATLASRAPT